jgi:hypothetical protein
MDSYRYVLCVNNIGQEIIRMREPSIETNASTFNICQTNCLAYHRTHVSRGNVSVVSPGSYYPKSDWAIPVRFSLKNLLALVLENRLCIQ